MVAIVSEILYCRVCFSKTYFWFQDVIVGVIRYRDRQRVSGTRRQIFKLLTGTSLSDRFMLSACLNVTGICSFDAPMRLRDAKDVRDEASPVCIFNVTEAGPLRNNCTT